MRILKTLESLRKPSEREQINFVYAKWQSLNRHSHARFVTYTGLFVSVLMIWGDRVFIEDVREFTKTRLIGIGLMFIGLIFLRRLSERTKATSYLKARDFLESLCLMAPIITYNFEYHYFVFEISNNNFFVYFTGLLLGVGFGTFMLHRFRIEQYLFHALFIGYTAYELSYAERAYVDYLYIVVIVHLVSGFVAWYLRQEFKINLISKAHLLSAFVPKQLAQHIAISNDSGSINSEFEARNCYTVCLCCDWRNYQAITQAYSPELVSKITEEYYNRVFETLNRIDPKGQHYANWTADELFIIFFDEENNHEDIQKRALEFTVELATRIFLEVRFDFQVALKYDIGLASGEGYLGLLGPARLKKTTIVGPSAGTAKRLETEAKTIRKQRTNDNPNPIVLMDSELFKTFQVLKKARKIEGLESQPITATTKDIQDRTFYLIQSQYFDIRTVSDEGEVA